MFKLLGQGMWECGKRPVLLMEEGKYRTVNSL
ncbi:hypothetical protein JOD43_002824 [Pullulanibacillus pueri]|nr:hypothetical protein [Pullulanibacillus pueri]